ncbi:MAG: Histidyl-tRNA synthetase [Microgenomates group bacterium GW2011_GWA1_48_10]|nr:MAG: Histidyl-tRNA synthetase [Microgenomates group bacterium GW2011_GWA1_48_10]
MSSSKQIEPRTLPGFRDFLPETLRVRKKVIQIFSEIFEKYGFEPLETPTLEFQDILLGKYGEEAEKLMYLFKDNGGRDVGLRYDLTVPTARVIAQYPNLPKPFKRYQIQPTWRAEKPQKGRYREFTQCDIDTFGTGSPFADAEIIAIIQECFSKVGFKEFTIRINSRQVLFETMETAGVPEEKYLTAIQSIDKLDKKSTDDVQKELSEKGLPSKTITNIFSSLKSSRPNDNLKAIFAALKQFGIPEDFYKFDPVLSRGLDYYTGAIFETLVTEPKIGSISGGGRYDKLIGQFTGVDLPAVGTTIGLDRTVDVITELNLWPDAPKTTVKALITIFSSVLLEKSFKIYSLCRQNNIPIEIYLDPEAKLDKQLKYADQKGIPFAVIIGPDEAAKNLVTVKNLRLKEQKTIPEAELLDQIRP